MAVGEHLKSLVDFAEVAQRAPGGGFVGHGGDDCIVLALALVRPRYEVVAVHAGGLVAKNA